MWFEIQYVGVKGWGSGFRVQIWGSEFRVHVQGTPLKVEDLGFRMDGRFILLS